MVESTTNENPSFSGNQGVETPISPAEVGSPSHGSVSGGEGDNEVLLEPGVASVEELLESDVFSKKGPGGVEGHSTLRPIEG